MEASEELQWSGSESESPSGSRPASRQKARTQPGTHEEEEEEEGFEEGKVYYVDAKSFPEIFPYLNSHEMRPPSPPRDENGNEIMATEDHTMRDWLAAQERDAKMRAAEAQQTYSKRIPDMEPSWEGRIFIPVGENPASKADGNKIRVCTYHVSADCKFSEVHCHYTTANNTTLRWEMLVRELKCYNPDVIALQDVDLFKEFWQPQLMLLGYDVVYFQRTCERKRHEEGVAIAYNKDKFQLFKTVQVEFNRAVDAYYESMNAELRDRCMSDDVALIAFLQPWQKDYIRSAICFTSAMLYDGDEIFPLDDEVRSIQAQYLTERIEKANAEFQLPVLIGICLQDEPSSPAYHLMRTGRVQLRQETPRKPSRPVIKPTCRGSVRCYWLPPFQSIADSGISSYRIGWKPGGSDSLGYRSQIEVQAGDAIQYTSKIDENGIRRTVPADELMTVISGLSSGIPYEFKVVGINDVGEGIWSDASEIIILNKAYNPQKSVFSQSTDPHRSIYLKTEEQVKQLQELNIMNTNDSDSHNAASFHPARSETNLSPRIANGNFDMEVSRGRVLPMSINPKDGWDPTAGGAPDPRIETFIENDEILRKEGLRRAENERKENRKMAEEEEYQRSLEAAQKAAIKAHFDAIRDRHNKVLMTYKTRKCSLKEKHDRVACYDYHLRSDRRRNPCGLIKYSCIRCPHETKMEMCGDGDECLMSHSDSEVAYHPDTFKITMCTKGADGGICSEKKNLCIYAHDEEDLREPGIHLPTPAGSVKVVDTESIGGSLAEQSATWGAGSIITGESDDMNESMIEDGDSIGISKQESSQSLVEESSSYVVDLDPSKMLEMIVQDYEDDILLDGKEALRHLGTRNPRQKHTLGLKSCYENYSVAGEPHFTTSVPERPAKKEMRLKKEKELEATGEEIERRSICREVSCMDYIFCSMHAIKNVSILSLPNLAQIKTEDPREPRWVPNQHHKEIPPMFEQFYVGCKEKIFEKLHISTTEIPQSEQEINSNISRIKAELKRQLDAQKYVPLEEAHKEKYTFYTGTHTPHNQTNPNRFNKWLPNNKFSSSHLALVADVFINFEACSADWDN